MENSAEGTIEGDDKRVILGVEGIKEEPLPAERKRGRKTGEGHVFSKEDTDFMERAFEKNPYPSSEDVEDLRETLSQTAAQIIGWFGTRRSKEKKTNPEFENFSELRNRNKRQREGRVFTKRDREFLERALADEPYPSKEDQENFAKTLDRKPAQIRNWFNKRRQEDKKIIPKAELKESKKKNSAQVFSEDDLDFLEDSFWENAYPSKDDYDNFRKRLGKNCAVIRGWFNKRREKERKMNPLVELKDPRKFSDAQRNRLQEEYGKSAEKPSEETMKKLSIELNLTCLQIDNWWRKRPTSIKTEQMEKPSTSRIVAEKPELDSTQEKETEATNFAENDYLEIMEDTTEGNRIARGQVYEDQVKCALAGQEAEYNEDYDTDYDSDASYEIVASTPLEPIQLPPDFNHACLTEDREIVHVKERDLVFEDKET